MINKIKFFIAWFGAFVNRKKIAKEHARKKAEAKKALDEKFMTSTKTLAQEMTEMHAAFKKSYPTNYVQKMQPYFIAINEYRKEFNVDPIEAAMFLVTKSTRNRDIIGYYATAAEMLNNLPTEKQNGTKGS